LQPFLQFYSALEENRERVNVIKQQIQEYKKSGGVLPGTEE
jgi:Tubulin-tyrosine ligase family